MARKMDDERKQLPSTTLLVEYQPVKALKRSPRNARSHSKKQLKKIAASLRAFGFVNPLLVDEDGQVLAGHGRLEAARLLGLEEVPTIRLTHMSEAEKRAYAVADNRIAELAGWDPDLLRTELAYIAELNIDFDLTLTGFDPGEIDILMDPGDLDGVIDALDPRLSLDTARTPVTQLGDVWRLGQHRLLCADSTCALTFAQVLEGRRADLVFTDPPYNVPMQGHASGRGRQSHSDFAMASGDMSESEFTDFLGTVFNHLVQNTQRGSIHFVCMDWRHIAELLAAARNRYTEVKNVCVWVKTNAGMGSLYRSQHELVFVLKNGAGPHVNNVELGRQGRHRTNVWTYPGANGWIRGRQDALAAHPTVKPVTLVADAIRDCSNRGAAVLDPFAGSGTTILAAELTKRIAYAVEIDPRYVDLAVQRVQDATGQPAVLESSGLTFENVRARRSGATRVKRGRHPHERQTS